MTEEKEGLAKRVSARLRAGSLVTIVQESDENLALPNIIPAANQYPPVRVVYPTDEDRDELIFGHAKNGQGTLILVDFLAVCGDNPLTTRAIRNVALQTRPDGDKPSRFILLEQPTVKIPPGLSGDVEVISSRLPDIEDLESELTSFLSTTPSIKLEGNGEVKYQIASSVSGLSRHEASRLFARSWVERKALDPVWLRAEKAKRVTQRLGGALTFESTEVPDVGGLDVLKAWLKSRQTAFGSSKARERNIPEPKGLLLLGVPGSGKSLTARSIAKEWGLPLLRLDAGRLFGSLVGQSENQTRQAIEAAEACSPCVLWIDEIEKAFGGGGGLDGGTSLRVFGAILTWLQDKKTPVFVVATANKASTVPPELLRKGRFDEVFFVGLPSVKERAEIFKIHLAKRKRTLTKDEIEVLANQSERFSGAEIEQAVIDGMFTAYNEADRDITREDISVCINNTNPLAKTRAEEIRADEQWASTRARAASSEQKFSKQATQTTQPSSNPPDDLPVVPIRRQGIS